MYRYLTSFLPPATLTETDFLTLLNPALADGKIEDTVIWLLGSYMATMLEAIEDGRVVVEQELKGTSDRGT